MVRKLFLTSIRFVVLVLVASCSSYNVESVHDEASRQVYFKDGVLYYYGSINKEKNVIAFDVLTGNKVEKVFMSSPGGLVSDAIQLAYRLHREQLDLQIGALCASSCANYIMPAARHVYLDKDSVLLWHGSSFQDDISEKVRDNNAVYVEWRKEENKFFSDIGISPLITVCGIENVSMLDEVLNLLYINKLAGFTYSIEDMKNFGIENIISPDNWTPKTEYNGMKIVTASYCEQVSWAF